MLIFSLSEIGTGRVKQQNWFEKHLDEINSLKLAVVKVMLEDEKSLEKVENWVKSHNGIISK